MDCDLVLSRLGHRESITSAGSLFLATLLFLIVPILPVRAHGQRTAANSSGSLEGRITCNDGGFPARGAHVSLSPIALLLHRKEPSKFPTFDSNSTSDFDGYYVIRGVPPGDYLVQVHLAGYTDDVGFVESILNRFPEQRQKELLRGLPQVTVWSGRVREDIVLRRGASISGRVSFDTGGTLSGASVEVTMVAGDLIGDPDSGQKPKPVDLFIPGITTDDRGIYRIAGLPKGKYRVAVEAKIMTVFAPDTLKESEAKPVAVDEGDEFSDVDITLPFGSFHAISGTVTRGGAPIEDAVVILQRQGWGGNWDGHTKPDGSFRFDMLLPGTYILEAFDSPQGSEERKPPIKRTMTVQLGNGDFVNADLDLLGRTPSE